MRVSRRSWHFKVFSWVCMPSLHPQPSVCKYWFYVLVLPILLSPFIVFLYGIAFPLANFWDKVQEHKKRKQGTLCPFGKVEWYED